MNCYETRDAFMQICKINELQRGICMYIYLEFPVLFGGGILRKNMANKSSQDLKLIKFRRA